MKLGRRLATKLANAGRFAAAAARARGRDARRHTARRAIGHPLDVDFAARLAELVETARPRRSATSTSRSALHASGRGLLGLLRQLPRDREGARVRRGASPERESALATLQLALRVFLRLFAPALPFVTEEVWSWRFAGAGRAQSIHDQPLADGGGVRRHPARARGARLRARPARSRPASAARRRARRRACAGPSSRLEVRVAPSRTCAALAPCSATCWPRAWSTPRCVASLRSQPSDGRAVRNRGRAGRASRRVIADLEARAFDAAGGARREAGRLASARDLRRDPARELGLDAAARSTACARAIARSEAFYAGRGQPAIFSALSALAART